MGLGTDGLAVSGQSIFEAMKSAYALHRLNRMDPTWPPAEQLLELACRHGARVLGRPVGVVEEGALADLVVGRPAVAEVPSPPTGRVAMLALIGHGADVRDVVVGGEVVVRRGRSTQVDEAEVMAKACEAAERRRRRGRSGAPANRLDEPVGASGPRS